MVFGKIAHMLLLPAFSLALMAGVAGAQEMTFRLVPAQDPAKCGDKCLQIIAADGEIVESTPVAFINFVKQHLGDQRVRSVLLFNSPGGQVAASLKLGYILRKIGAATVVARARGDGNDGLAGFYAGRCYSACVYALMGGKKRVIPPSSEVGIHRSYIARYGDEPQRENPDSRPKIDPDLTLSIIGKYSDAMGVSRGLIEEAQRTNSSSIHIVTRSEMARWRLGGSSL